VRPLADAIAAARAEADLPDTDAHLDALAVHQQVYGALTERAARDQLSDPDQVDAVVGWCLRAVLASPVERPRGRPRR
jgi:hypothetical protein